MTAVDVFLQKKRMPLDAFLNLRNAGMVDEYDLSQYDTARQQDAEASMATGRSPWESQGVSQAEWYRGNMDAASGLDLTQKAAGQAYTYESAQDYNILELPDQSPVRRIAENIFAPLQGKGINSKSVQSGYPTAAGHVANNLAEIRALLQSVGVANPSDKQILQVAQQVIQPGQFDEKGGYADQYTNFLNKVNIPVARALATQAGKGEQFEAVVRSPQMQQAIAQRETEAKKYGDINSKYSEHTNLAPILGMALATLAAPGLANLAAGVPFAGTAASGVNIAMEGVASAITGAGLTSGASGAGAAGLGGMVGAASPEGYPGLAMSMGTPANAGAVAPVVGAETGLPGLQMSYGTFAPEMAAYHAAVSGVQSGLGNYLGEGLKTGGEGLHMGGTNYGVNTGLGVEAYPVESGVGSSGGLGGYQASATNSLGFQVTPSALEAFDAGIGLTPGNLQPYSQEWANRVSYTGAQSAGLDVPMTNLRPGYYGSEMPMPPGSFSMPQTWMDNGGLQNLNMTDNRLPSGQSPESPAEPGTSAGTLKDLLKLGSAFTEMFGGGGGGGGQPGYEAPIAPIEYGGLGNMFAPAAGGPRGSSGRGFLEVDIGAPGLQVPGLLRR